MIIEYIRPCPIPTPTTMIIGPVPKVISFSQLSFKIAIIALQKIDDIQTMTCDVTLDKRESCAVMSSACIQAYQHNWGFKH